MKTLVLILHYNTLDLTNSLYESLDSFQENLYDLFILNNGSDQNHKSEYSSLYTNKNLYFGGGLNWAFDYVLKNPKYDSLLFLNSDLILEGKNFVKTLRKEMFDKNFKILSSSILVEAGTPGCKWQQMSNWKSNDTRQVEWVDFQCPMFHIDFISYIKSFDDDLIYGWGQDSYSGFVCKNKKWKIGVTDKIGVEHLDSVTEKKTKGKSKLAKLQSDGHIRFLKKNDLVEVDTKLRKNAKRYKF